MTRPALPATVTTSALDARPSTLLADGVTLRAALIAGGAATLFPAINALIGATYGSTVPAIRESLQLSSIENGVLGSSFVLAIALGQLVAGPIIDRYGPARPIAVAALIAGVAAALFATSQSLGVALTARLMLGAAASVAMPSFGCVTARITCAGGIALAMGLVSCACGAAGFVGSIIGASASAGDAWRDPPWICTAAAIPIAAVVLVVLRGSRFAGRAHVISIDRAPSLIDLLRTPVVRRACLIAAGLGGVFSSFSGLWNAHVVRVIWQIPDEQRGLVTGMFQIGFAVGAIAIPLIALRTDALVTLRWATAVACAAFAMWILSPLQLTAEFAAAIAALLGASLAAMAVNMGLAVRSVPRAGAATCVALISSVGLMSGFAMAFLPPLTTLIPESTSLTRSYCCGAVMALVIGIGHAATYRRIGG